MAFSGARVLRAALAPCSNVWRSSHCNPMVRSRHLCGQSAGHIIVNGVRIDIGDSAETLLDLCIRSRIAIPWECKEGTCGSCRISVTLEGTSTTTLACRELPANGMHCFISSPVCHSLQDPSKLADDIIRLLEYSFRSPQLVDMELKVNELLPVHGGPLLEKLSGKRLQQVLRGEYIHLDQSGLNDLDALVLARAVKQRNAALRLLDLNGNSGIGAPGVNYIADELVASDHELRSLFLSSCGVTDEGCAALVHALRKNDDIKILELRKNGLTDASAQGLASALAEHPTLESVFLAGNHIGDEGAFILAEAVVSASSDDKKTRVWLNENPSISEEAKLRIKGMVPRNSVKF